MADAVVSIAMEGLGLVEDELKLLFGNCEEVDKLSDMLHMLQKIHPYLHDAEVRQFNEPDVGAWLKKLKYVAYEVDDVVDEWQMAKSQLLSIGANPVWNFFAQFTCSRQLALSLCVGKNTRKINSKLDHIFTLGKKFDFLKSSPMTTVRGEEAFFSSVVRNARKTTSSVEEIFGREDEIKLIKDKLINSSETSKLAVVSIVGPAGFGKTTLAKSVFNHGQIVQHFNERIWVCVSDEFDEASIMGKMIEAVKEDTPSVVEIEALKEILVDKILRDKTFLLVLDDVWNENYRKWEKFYSIIKSCGTKGSRILVTTRSEKVCEVMGSAHDMMFQVGIVSSFEHCWSIFESVAFENRDDSERPKLRKVGEEIMNKCKGVPLAIKTVAGALRTERTKEDWEHVLKSNMWDWQPKSETGILPALLLSYYQLSPQLKQCFRYCTIYPKDYRISKDEIVPQWIAHGYVAEEKNMELEDVAENYFDELVARSLFQEPELDIYDNKAHYKMLDLIHDLVRFVTEGEFLVIKNEENSDFDIEYPPLHCKIVDMESLNTKIYAENLRTFISTSCERELRMGDCQIEKMQHLRVLELNSWSFEMMPDVVGKFVHLRFLKLCKGKFKASSSSIENLQNLLYLDLSWASIDALPKSVGKLKKLRHLNLSYNPNFTALPSAIGRLTNLRKFDLKGTSLDEIPDCIGKLGSLRYLNLEATGIRGLPSAIGRLTCLRKLDLKGTSLDEIPDCIGKLGSLWYLNLAGTKIRELPESIMDLSRLQVLDVSYCIKLKNLPDGIFDKMPDLKQLGINGIGLQHGLLTGMGKLSSLQRLDEFWVAGNHDGSSSSSSPSSNIWELRDLNHLHGYLQIHNLDMVTSGEEAASAQLHNKNSLTRLKLEWSIDSRGGAKETTSEQVLQALRPCTTLPELRIDRYPGCTVPIWLGDSTILMLSGLQKLFLSGWPACTDLPALGNLPKLRQLCIVGMPKVRRVGAEWVGSNHGFPKLEYLQFIKMAEWEGWHLEEKSFFTFPSLRKFQIYRCPKLQSLPSIFSTSLQEIYVDECSNLSNWLKILPASIVITLKSISAEWVNEMPNFPNLECLGIRGDGRASEVSNHLVKLGALKTLVIQNCPNLESLPQDMASLKQLQKLEIYDCHKLKEGCNKEGAQWYKIQHIPSIEIDGEDVRRNA